MARACMTMLALLSLGSAQPAPTAPAPPTSDQVLWRQIETLDSAAPAPGGPDWYASLRARRGRVLAAVRQYLTLYPGGPQRDAAIRRELELLYEIGSLEARFDSLRTRVEELLAAPPSHGAETEAAFWRLRLIRLRTESDALEARIAQESLRPPPASRDPTWVEAAAGFTARYPRSAYVPRIVALLSEQAGASAETEQRYRETLGLALRNWSMHATLRELVARASREDRIGQPVRVTGTDLDGRAFDSQALRGRAVAFVVWATFDAEACRAAREIEAIRLAHPALQVVGVSFDAEPDPVRRVTADLGIGWRQLLDRRGWGGTLPLEWGLRQLPALLVLDADGALFGVAEGAAWRELLARASERLRTSDAAASPMTPGGSPARAPQDRPEPSPPGGTEAGAREVTPGAITAAR